MRDPLEKFARIAGWQKVGGLWLPGVRPFMFTPGGSGCGPVCEVCKDYQYAVTFSGVSDAGCGVIFCNSLNDTFVCTYTPEYAPLCIFRHNFDECFAYLQVVLASYETYFKWSVQLVVEGSSSWWWISSDLDPTCVVDTSSFGLVTYAASTCAMLYVYPHLQSIAP